MFWAGVIVLLHRLSDESGSLEFTLVSEGTLDRGYLDPKDGELVFWRCCG